jgi:hypothetical protein
MLVPFQTLPGWPTVPDPSVLNMLAIFVGFPLVVTAIIVAIAKLRPAKNVVPGSGGALWLRGDQPEPMSGSDQSPAIEARRAATAPEPGAERGGARARW